DEDRDRRRQQFLRDRVVENDRRGNGREIIDPVEQHDERVGSARHVESGRRVDVDVARVAEPRARNIVPTLTTAMPADAVFLGDRTGDGRRDVIAIEAIAGRSSIEVSPNPSMAALARPSAVCRLLRSVRVHSWMSTATDIPTWSRSKTSSQASRSAWA